ncbi:MAG TPA: Ig-like domain-containing protein, partial [Tepidisphaeraceae bacterium]|nr:Ig-like domain-containing protein [Tepidisphaeraceae bacterium]
MNTGKLLRRKQILNRAWNLGSNAGLEALESRMLLSAPYVTVMSPFEAGQGVGVSTKVSVRFDQGMNPTTISSSTFQLFDSFNNQVSGRISYNSVNQTVTFDANAPLAYSTGYRAVVKGGTSGVKNSNNEAMGGDVQWTFTTSAAPEEGPGGPILVVTAGSNAFSSYYAEILRAEGLNEFATADLSSVSTSMLASYDVVILGEASLTSGQVGMFTDWVTSGGNLIAMRPDRQLSNLLGLNYAGSTQTEGYLLVNTTSGPGVGITGETMQFHGVADRYTINDAVSIATLYSSASNATSYPAVTVRTVGTQGGQAAAFTFDLARSIVYTRQGNPAWAGQERDNAAGSGTDVIRPDDLFNGGNVADWVDLNKVSIPQADEQQRLLANMVTQMNADQMPLPRFWYLPDGAKAALIMTGDDHAYGSGAVSNRFDDFLENSPSGSSASSWTANHGTVYMFPSTNVMSREQAAYYTANGFEIALHVQSLVGNYESTEQLNEFYNTQLATFNALYPNLPTPSTHRMHAIIWSDYTSQPEVEFDHRIRLDTNYYYYPDFWMLNYPGIFTGSG